ncbi:MAG: TatD family hydrolase [Clostridia bacterium]|nr:TatD family hydrolase [Clostridia bacterium]
MIFDSHAHYDDEQFDIDRTELLGSVLPSKGVEGIIDMSSSYESIEKVMKLTEDYPNIYGAVGIHPENAKNLPEGWLEYVENCASNKKIIAIGEIGLDYYWEDACPRDIQKDVFIAQVELANRLNLPISVHDRDAHGDTFDILRKYRPRGVVHCFSGSVELAREIVKLGMYIGVGGVVTFKNARHSVDVVRDIPLDRLLLETDCPYLSPVPMRGKRNDSSNIAYTATKVAEIKGISITEVLESSRENIRTLFGI